MVNILKFNQQKYGNVYFISDLHICHSKLVEQRGFDTVEEMNKTIIDNWNSTISNDAIVFALGDIVLGAGENSLEVFKGLLDTLNYRELYLCSGNHSAGYRRVFNETLKEEVIDEFYRLPYRKMKNVSKTVYFIPNYYEIFVDSIPVILSHYSLLSWNGQAGGSFHLAGHSHMSLHKNAWIEENYYKGKVLDVGFEFKQRPVSFNEIRDIMRDRDITSFDHHTHDTQNPL